MFAALHSAARRMRRCFSLRVASRIDSRRSTRLHAEALEDRWVPAPINVPPTSTPPTLAAVNEDGTSVPVTLTAQDSDAANTTLTCTITALPKGGTLLYDPGNTGVGTNLPVYLGQQFVLSAPGTATATLNLRYLPGGRYAGGTAPVSPDQFNYAVTDSPVSPGGAVNTIARHVNITVNPIPAANASSATGTGTKFLVKSDGMYAGANNVLYVYGSTASDFITITGTPAAGFTIKRTTGAITTTTNVLAAQSAGIVDVRVFDLGSATGSTEKVDVGSLAVRSLLVGGAGTQVMKGGSATSIIYGRGSNGVLTGGAADDFIYGGDGFNTIFGLAGNDILSGGAGSNVISGGAGSNIFYGGSNGSANNLIYGNSTTTDASPFIETLIIQGTDAMNLTAFLGGNAGTTVLVPPTTSAPNAIPATANSDAIPANPLKLDSFAQGNKSINGARIFNANGQPLFGGTGVSGSPNNTMDFRGITFDVGGVVSVPYIDTGVGADTLYASNDGLDLRGGAGNKTFFGGSGGDSFDVRGGGRNRLQGGSGDDTFFVTGNSLANDTLLDGGGGNNVIKNVGSDGLLNGAGTLLHSGRDSIPATGDVVLTTFGPNAGFHLGSNIQTFDVSGFGIDGTPTVPANLDFTTVSFKVSAVTTLTQITGTPFNDILRANNEGLTILGLAGSDTLIGGTGGDTLEGGTGADLLMSGGGNDNLYGWDVTNVGVANHDDGSRDTFLIKSGGSGSPTLWDFDPDHDVIDLRAFRPVPTSSMVLSFTTPPPTLAPNTVYAAQDTVIPADTLLTVPTGQQIRIKNLLVSPTTLRTASVNGLVNLML
jgi:Ca2+-binding RTX toxin-like protein